MGSAAKSSDGERFSLLHRPVPLPTQVLFGLLAIVLGLLAARLLTWPAMATWREVPLPLLVITVVAGAIGITAGMTAALLAIIYYGASFATGGLTTSIQDLSWLPLFAVAAVGSAAAAGMLRERFGRMEQELSGAHAMLQGANRRLEAAQHAERIRGYYDHLTDLPSRRLVIDRAAQLLSQARRANTLVALLLLDLRGFSEVNHLVGHDAGDEVLRQIGQRLVAVMRREDTVGRLDSDTFVVLLTGLTEVAGVTIAAQKIAEALNPPFLAGQPPRRLQVSAHVGAAVFPQDGQDWETLYRFAEESLLVAKRPA